MTDAYYPELDPGIMTSTARMRAAERGPYPERELSAQQGQAYRAACAAQGVAFTDRDGNHVLDGTRGGEVRHACRGAWSLAGQNGQGHNVFTCDASSHRYVAVHRDLAHVCAGPLDCASGAVTVPASTS